MGSPGSPESNGKRSRAYLLLSTIFLVWNTVATARYLSESGALLQPDPSFSSPVPVPQADPPAFSDTGVSARKGPLSVRQRYLLGKRVDINRAPVREISGLPGISDAVAAAVVAERTRRKGFRSPSDLLSVPGIKEKRLEKILPFLAEMENN